MKRALLALLVIVALGAVASTVWLKAGRRLSAKTAQFQEDADQLIQGLQEYRKFVGHFPSGSAIDISNALTGQSDSNKKVLIFGSSTRRKNERGELVDPWGTPLQFYFSQNSALIRSAGPNRIFEDSTVPGCDDLYRSETK